jgi:hypothetical protein
MVAGVVKLKVLVVKRFPCGSSVPYDKEYVQFGVGAGTVSRSGFD